MTAILSTPKDTLTGSQRATLQRLISHFGMSEEEPLSPPRHIETGTRPEANPSAQAREASEASDSGDDREPSEEDRSSRSASALDTQEYPDGTSSREERSPIEDSAGAEQGGALNTALPASRQATLESGNETGASSRTYGGRTKKGNGARISKANP